MKCFDMSRHAVVRCGLAWPHDQLPSTKDMIPRLERNEAYVSWMQPHGGIVEDMFPAIQIEKRFYTLSLRMMKAVWRHVRLKKGFVNREMVPHVGTLLRIPTVLLMEKIRTQERFNVSCALECARRLQLLISRYPQVMRSKAQPREEESRGVKFRDMHWVVCDVLVKLPTPESVTVFRLDEREILENLVSQIRRDCPKLVTEGLPLEQLC